MGGFTATGIDIPWPEKQGAGEVLGIQVAITWAALTLVIFIHLFGKKLWQWHGSTKFPSVQVT